MKSLTIGSIVFVLLLAAPHQAIGVPDDPNGIPDAECLDNPSVGNGFTPYWALSKSTQSFVARRTGKILAARAYDTFRSDGSEGYDVTMDIVNVDVNGQPQDPPLGSTIIDGGSIPVNAAFDLTGFFERSTAPRLVEGQTYGLRLYTDDNVQNSWGFESGDPCPGVRSNSDAGWDHFYKIWLVNKPPVIKDLKPGRGSEIRKRRPTIGSKVWDSVTNLRKSSIDLFINGQEKRRFDYNRITDKLTFESRRRMAIGRHEVKVRATDKQGKSTTKTWTFKIVR